jgi:hypothetical protein
MLKGIDFFTIDYPFKKVLILKSTTFYANPFDAYHALTVFCFANIIMFVGEKGKL